MLYMHRNQFYIIMKRMHVIMLAVALTGITVMESCKKYEEGPGLSFRSRKERVANVWRVGKYIEGGIDKTNQEGEYPNGQWVFSKNGDLSVSTTVLGVLITATGSWDLIDNDNKISYTYTVGNSTVTGEAVILMLKEKEMWLRDEMGNTDPADDQEYHFVPAD